MAMPTGNLLTWEQQLTVDGYVVIPQVVPDDDVLTCKSRLKRREVARAGTRTLLDEPWCAALGQRLCKDARLSPLLPHDAHVAQCTLFDKSLDRNWLVTLHQDLSIPVADRVESPLCAAWVAKEGVLHVQPPPAVLEDLLVLRMHLDDCDENNGALRVVPGSHRAGRLSQAEAYRFRDEHGERSLPVLRGSALLMRPLLLHSSSRAVHDAPRRVLHFLIGPALLPQGLRWPQSALDTVKT